MKIQILIDNIHSWIIPYAKILKNELDSLGHKVTIINKHKEVTRGDVLCLLSCERIFRSLDLNKYNLVVHESDLPKGKGWSPLTWQILQGKNEIPVTLFEAAKELDSGQIYLQESIYLEGTELLNEIKDKQGIITNKLILNFIRNIDKIVGIPQEGKSTYYERRTKTDSELDIKQSIDDQFNLLRVCDNDRYPAYFYKNGVKYILKIEKIDNV